MSDTGEPVATPARDRQVRALPVIAVCVMAATAAAIVLAGRFNRPATRTAIVTGRRSGEPAPVRDEDHYVPGTPPAVCERFLRSWMRYHYDDARDLATGAMRASAEQRLAELGTLNAEQMEEYRHTRAYVDATHFDLEHVQMRELPAAADGLERKEVQGQAHAYGSYDGVQMDSRRGQTFVVALVNGAWRVESRTWETFGP